jgi:NAD-dependent SIR2 family protein deacetylase
MDNNLISRIANGEYKNIVVVTGAGISTNSGIPDYRSSTGFFARLIKEFPEAKSIENIFSRTFMNDNNVNDHPVYKTIIESMKSAIPTVTHNLCKLFYDKGWLKRVYTQNIDGLHQKAGLPTDMVIEYHGSITDNTTVLYGDNIPQYALTQTISDFCSDSSPIDLILVMGTSLQVAPFCAIPNMVRKECTRVLIDLHPENAFTNSWTKRKSIPEGIYSNSISSDSFTKIGNRKVSLRPQWSSQSRNSSKWKDQYIITSDTDIWSQKVIDSIATSPQS